MAIVMIFLMNLNAVAEVRQFSFAVSKQDQLFLAYPNLEVELYTKTQKMVSIEVDSGFPISLVKEGTEIKLKSSEVEEQLAKGLSHPPVKMKVFGDVDTRISAIEATIKSEGWRSPLKVDALTGKFIFAEVLRGANLRIEQGSVSWQKGSGELKIKCGNCDTSIQKHRGNLQVDQLTGTFNSQEVMGSQNLQGQKVKMLITESAGRLEISADEGVVEIAKISGFAEIKSTAAKISVRPGAESQISILDKKSKIELKNEAPLWVDLSSEEGTIAVAEPFKAQRTSFETVLKGPMTPGTPRTRVVVKTQSGHISVK